MDLKLSGKRALVTGSTKGIGLAIAMELAREGCRVIVNGRTEAAVAAAIGRIQAALPAATLEACATDLATAEGAEALTARFPELDILVNNVGIYERKAFEEIPDADWQRFFDVNVMSGVRLARAFLPGMKARDWGRIVFISSESGIHIPAEMVHYGMTKTAQLAVSRGIAETCAGTNVTCNAVLPGPTRSDGLVEALTRRGGGRPMAEMEEQLIRVGRPSSLIRRLAEPEEVATMVAYVCSPLASATNGAALRVEGGIVRACF
ncbi:MAG: 3-oxoacyl-[acyl-carrier-protein] reductase FabG [Pseudomonadota bacterium]|jgi:NAD(P)-dependent dehydrogenase (short-subunit alcohol dehydrogenase family)